MTTLTNSSSRRALLAGAAAGLAVVAADHVARPLAAEAADGDTIHVGDSLTAESTTTITNSDTPAAILHLEGTHSCPIEAVAVERSAIVADSRETAAIWGRSQRWIGVQGNCDEAGPDDPGIGVQGNGSHAGVMGRSASGVGVTGDSDTGWGVTGGSHGTVFGMSGGVMGGSDLTVGVFGLSAQGIAVEGRSDHDPATGIGVKGYSRHGDGLVGESDEGTAVHAQALAQTATALVVEGRVSFTTAGLDAVGIGSRSATINPKVPLTARSKVLVTLMSDPGLRDVKFVSVNPTAGTFQVHLTGLPAVTPVKFAWFVIE
jgi:hypothetical protein